jgi:acid phosphatase type 7
MTAARGWARAAPVLRYIYSGHTRKVGANGWNLMDVGPSKSVIDGLSRGTRALVWVGDYNNRTCGFEVSGSGLRADIAPLVGDPRVAGYFISDEPDPYACPGAYSQHQARTALIHTLDPGKFVLTVLDSNSGQQSLDQMPGWLGTSDYVGLDPYPCYVHSQCNYGWIDEVIAEADADGLPYWGVVQSFKDTTWRWPTVTELDHMLRQWSSSAWRGLATFAWKWAGHCLCSAKRAALLDAWRAFNKGVAGTDPVIGAAGDIAPPDTGGKDDATSNELLRDGVAAVLTLGDNQYEAGAYSDFVNYFDKRWGRLKSIMYPSPGNHEYDTSGATGYFQYFGSGAPVSPVPKYYSFDVGSWHMISLNVHVPVGRGSMEETWLAADLAAHPNACTLAYWHEPRFSSGSAHGNDSTSQALWNDLYAAHADVVLNGHDHEYERFAPQTPGQVADPNGITEFVVGTGGNGLYSFGSAEPNSVVRYNGNYGVIEMTLHPASFDWVFKTISGNVVDSGTQACV